MQIKVGADIVYIPKFIDTCEQASETFLSKIFLEQELNENSNLTHLAGAFAAKEAVIKALSLPVGSWQSIVIRKNQKERPFVELLGKNRALLTSDLSISHDGNYAIAVFIGIQ